MKFIKFERGRGVYHIRMTNARNHKGSFLYRKPAADSDVAYCNGNYATFGDIVSDDPPGGRLCPRCRKKYLKDHTEEELMLKLI